MAEIDGIITLDKFVKKILFKTNKNHDEYFRVFQVVADGLRHLCMHSLGFVTWTKLTVDTDTNTIDFPDDYVGFVSLSVPDDGRMWQLTRNDDLVPTTSTDSGGLEYLDEDDGEGVDLNDELVPIGYGTRGGYNDYYYQIDHKKRRFIINGITTDHVILRYISSGVNATTSTSVPLYLEEPLEYYVFWKMAEYEGAREDVIYGKRQSFNLALRRMKKFNAPSIQEVKDAIYTSANQSLHR
jgi:hypothetical protein